MALVATCACGRTYRVRDSLSGKQFACRECGTLVRVPDQSASDEGALPVLARPRKKSPPRDAADLETEEPRATGWWKPWAIGTTGAVILLAIQIALLGGWNRYTAVGPLLVTGLLIASAAYGDFVFRRRLRAEIERSDGVVTCIEYHPIRLWQRSSWGGRRWQNFYRVYYRDRDGSSKWADCFPTFWGGIVWAGDAGDAIDWTDLSDQRVQWFWGLIVVFLLMTAGGQAYAEAVYHFAGQSTNAVVLTPPATSLHQPVATRSRRRPRRNDGLTPVSYRFTDAAGATHTVHQRWRRSPAAASINPGSRLAIQYVPGAPGWSRPADQSSVAWLWGGALLCGGFVAIYFSVLILDRFDVFGQSRLRRRRSRDNDDEDA